MVNSNLQAYTGEALASRTQKLWVKKYIFLAAIGISESDTNSFNIKLYQSPTPPILVTS